MNHQTKEKIRAALKGQSTGLVSEEIRERGGIAEAAACMAALIQMVKAGEVVKHADDSPRKSRYSLNPEFISDAPEAPQRRTAGKKRTARTVPATREPERAFVPALTVDHGLVLFHEGTPPLMFSPEQTIAIATLLAANFG